MTSNECVEFGERKEGQHYQVRPGSYAVIVRDDEKIVVMRTGQGFFLPGGGAELGETPEDTLRREVLEECGRDVEIVRPLGFAIEYVFAEREGYFAKECSFYEAKLLAIHTEKSEEDHCLEWLPLRAAIECLTHESHAWAVARLKPA